MTFEELKKENYSVACYNYLISMLTIRKQEPVRVARIDNYTKSRFIIFKKCQTGKIDTKSFDIPREEAVFFNSWLATDFPNITIKCFDVRK